jgi:hypothetical protein
VTVGGSFNATEGGCLYEKGDGGASQVSCCNHGGGSYGGLGISGSVNTNLPECKDQIPNCAEGIKNAFGNETSIALQGSGGAGSQGGKGGGVIWIHASNVFSLNGTIEARGGDSLTEPGASYGSGGGSGGSISINTANVTGTSNSTIFVSGGNGKQGGGGGAGGWIYGNVIHFTNDSHNVMSTQRWIGSFNLSAGFTTELYPNQSMIGDGDGDHDGRTGHPDCPAGFEGVFCSPCLTGYYQSELSTDL